MAARGSAVPIVWSGGVLGHPRSSMRRDWWLAAMCALLCDGCRAAELATPARPAISTRDLMRSVVEPNAFVVWNAVKTVGTFAGIEEWQPKSDAEWMAVRRAAMTVAEAGSQLMSLPRARERDEWIR